MKYLYNTLKKHNTIPSNAQACCHFAEKRHYEIKGHSEKLHYKINFCIKISYCENT